jgi:hypothetical protein
MTATLSVLVTLAICSGGFVNAFSTTLKLGRAQSLALQASTENENGWESATRRDFFAATRTAAASVFTPALLSSLATSGVVLPVLPANAVSGVNKVNAQLAGYGLPPAIVPDGLTPLLEIYGKGRNRQPVLVSFAHPITWVVVTPSNDKNGEDGK